MAKILVTGGCGYIGSHTLVDLIESGFEVVSVDNLVNSTEQALEGIKAITGKNVKNYTLDLSEAKNAQIIFSENPDIDAVIHFAALKAVGESTKQPLRYFKNNIGSLINVLKASLENNTTRFIFSSSCTVYGNAEILPVTEKTPLQKPTSPYGQTKKICESILEDTFRFIGGQFVILRYFNPAGAHPSYLMGENPSQPALNLVPIITETAIGKINTMHVFGNDYDTRDGTCIRDYIHIMDLAKAHTLSLKHLLESNKESSFEIFNLGIGKGVTVLEAIKAFEKVSGKELNYTISDRRPGDVVAMYSDFKKAKETLQWTPKHSIEDILSSAWEWEKKRSS